MTNVYVSGILASSDRTKSMTEPCLATDKPPSLTVEYRTWARDSQELYDYESIHVYRGRHIVYGSCRLVRTELEVNPARVDQTLYPGISDLLLSIRERHNRYYVFPAEINISRPATYISRKMWLVIRYLSQRAYTLREGDLLKLGRFRLRLQRIVTEQTALPGAELGANNLQDVLADIIKGSLKFNGDNSTVSVSDSPDPARENLQCRFCLTELNDENNPLIHACECNGSIKYVHYECLQMWILGKLNLKDESASQKNCITIRAVTCELCHVQFPLFVNYKGWVLSLIELPPLPAPYLIFETLGTNGLRKAIHICFFGENPECRLGRGHESDLRDDDVSISRWHATIHHQNGEFLLEDNNSKFGTLVELRKPVILDSQNHITIQVGRSVMSLKVA